MLNLPKLLRAYRDAGSVNELVAVTAFLDDYAFLTKAGHVGMAFRIHGADFECLDNVQRREVVHRFEAALRTLDDRCRVYQYLHKRRVQPFTTARHQNPVIDRALQERAAYLNSRAQSLYEIDLYFVLTYEGLQSRFSRSTELRNVLRRPRRAFREWLSTLAVLDLLEADIELARSQLEQKAAVLETQLGDTLRPTRLKKSDAFRFLRRLVNYAPATIDSSTLKYDTHVDYFIADSTVECHRSHLEVGSHHVQVLTMKEPPSATYAHLLEDLYAVPGEFIACLEWRRLPTERMRRELQTRRRHFFNKRVALVNYVAPDVRPDEMLVDESAGATVRQLGDALTEMEINGHFFGECSLTLVVFDEDSSLVAKAAAEAAKVMAAHDGVLVSESYNLLNAWLSVLPGNCAHNLRRLALLETNCADLSFLFSLDGGSRVSDRLGGEALAVFETRHQTPYFVNLHVGDVGHTVVLGPTGAGKSFLLNFLITHAQKYDPMTVIFDIGHSYRKLASVLQGSYVQLGLHQQGVTINPFAAEPTPEHLHFLHAFARVLIENADAYRLSDAEDRELYEAIESVYVLDRDQRRLYSLANLLPRSLSTRLSRWIEGGRYADLFDHVEDTLDLQRFQVFELEAMREFPALLEPLLFYVLHRVNAALAAPAHGERLTMCVVDEAWRFVQHERLRAYIEEALKTWRKRNGAMVLATQMIDDFASDALLRTVVESCPTKLLLPNAALDRTQYAELFGLNELELDLLSELVPRQQFMLKRPGLSKVLSLSVDPRSYWLYTNTPIDNQRLATAVQDRGLDAGLQELAASA